MSYCLDCNKVIGSGCSRCLPCLRAWRRERGDGTPLTPVPSRAVAGWNERIRRWVAGA